MKKVLILLFTLVSTYSYANPDMNHQRPDDMMGPPPQEAIQSCVNQEENSACQTKGPRGEAVQGQCKTTPDNKYFACMPERPPRR